jgi:hypothetical protein
MNVLILQNNEAFSKLTSDKIARQHFIAYSDGPNHFRVVKDRMYGTYGAKINADTLHWYISQYEKK